MPLTIRWIQPSFICSVGKPPLPRRSMMLARVGNGDKFIVFGGAGVDTGPAKAKKSKKGKKAEAARRQLDLQQGTFDGF